MATLIQSKQIQGIVTASAVEGDFIVSGQVIATGSESIFSAISSSGPIYGVRYDDIQGTPSFVGGTGILITQVGDVITITNTGGGGGVSGSAELISSVAQLNAFTGSNDIIIVGLQQQIDSLIAATSSYETKGRGIISGSSQLYADLDARYALSGSIGRGGVSSWNDLTDIPSGLVSSSDQILGGSGVLSGSHTDISSLNEFTSSIQSQVDALINATSSYLTSETDSQTLTIVGDQLTISGGNTVTIPTGSGSGTSDFTQLTNVPSGLVSSSDQINLAGVDGFSSYFTSVNDAQNVQDARLLSLESFTASLDSTYATDSDLTSLSASIATEIGNIQHTQIPSGTISSSQQISDLGFVTSSGASGEHTDISSLNNFTSSIDGRLSSIESTTSSLQSQIDSLVSATSSYLTSETDNQTLTIVGDQLTISGGNTITIPTGSEVSLPSGLISSSQQILDLGFIDSAHTDITQLNQFTQSIQSEINALSSATASYLTELPSGLVSGSVLRTLDGTDVLSGSILPGTGITIDSSSGDYVITSTGGAGDTSFDGNREVTNTLLGDLFSQSYNAGTSGSIQDFLNEMFFPSYAPTATFTTQTSNLNTNLTADGTVIETISITDTVDDSPYVVTISNDGGAFRVVPTNVDSSSWEIQSIDNLLAGTFTYDITITDKNSASRTYSGRSIEILQAGSGTLTPTGTFYIIESATTGPIYLGSNGRSGAQGGVSVSYSPNYGSQVVQNFTSSNPLISIASNGLLSVGSPISGSGNISGDIITSTISWVDQYGNSSSDTISVNVTQNNAPDIQFSNSTLLNTNQAVNGGGTLVTISFSDTEGDSINHSSFQFTDVSGQLTATRSGNNYLVTANSNLSGSTTYTIGVTIEDVHGFRSNTESHSFTITQSGNGTITGDTTIYIVESALTGDSFRDATGFGNGNIADVNVTYSPSAGSQTVQSFSSSNPAILIDSIGNMTLGVDLSGSVTQSGDSFTSIITFQDQYGNIGSGSVTANVFSNLAPSVSFVATSNYNTDNALANSNAGVITISDTESNSPYNVILSGTDAASFNVVPQNSISSSWQVQPKSTLSLGTYSIDIVTTDNYGKVSTLSNKSISVSSANDYGVIYVYTQNLGPAGSWAEATYKGIYGISVENGDTPPEVTSFTTAASMLSTIANNDVIGDSTITFNSSYIMTLRDTINGSTTLNSALSANGSVSFGGTANILLLYPSGSDMVVPTTIQQSINGTIGGGVPYLNADNGGWGIASAKLNSITLGTPHLGYSEWFVLGRLGTDGVGSSFEYRIVDADGGSAPS